MSSIPPPGHSHPRGTPPLGSGSPRPTVAVHLQYMHVVGEPVQQRAGEALRAEDLGPFVEGQIGGHHDGAPLVALAEDLEEEFRAGGGQGDEAQFVDDQQVELGQIPLQVEQPSLIPGIQRSALPRFHRRDAPAGGPGWKQPCLRPRLGIPPCRSSGGGWKTRFISPWQGGILLPIPARGAAG